MYNFKQIHCIHFFIKQLCVSSVILLSLMSHGSYAADAPKADATASLPAIEHFFQDPTFSDAQLSPDGKHVAFLVGAKDARARLAVLDLSTLKSTVIASFDEAAVRHFRWVNDKRMVLNLSVDLTGPGRTDRGSGLFAVDADGTNFRQLVETQRSFIERPTEGRQPVPWNHHLHHDIGLQNTDEILVESPEERSDDKTDYVKLKTLNTKTIALNELDAPLHSVMWLLNSKAEVQVAMTHEADLRAIHALQADGKWKKLHEFKLYDSNSIWLRYLDRDGTLYVTSNAHQDKRALYTFDLTTGKLSDKPVLRSKEFDVNPQFVVNDQKVLGVRYTVDGEVTHWLDVDMKSLQDTLDHMLPRTANRISVPRRGNSPFVLVETYSDKQPLTSLLYNKQSKKLIKLGSEYPQIDPKQMGASDFVRYKASDGLEIPAYMTLPAGAQKRNLPLVVLVHGGPWVRGASWHWDAEVQFLASRGYAVLQPEFRGSTGFGNKHFDAGWKQWGLKMQSDVADGARWAIAKGIADPKRICVAGASYGGYAALMGLVNDSELFRCGINWVGVSDISLMFTVTWSDFNNEWKNYGMRQLIGDPDKDALQFKATSPIAQASKIKQPLLMAYGAYDIRVPIVHGEKMRDVLKPHNPNLEWVVYDKEGHGWSKVETRLDFWARVEKFLAKHLAPQP
jgi:dipeptidyl aminopeptidase/acylaminoacyl peptidase